MLDKRRERYKFMLVYWIEQPWEHGYYAIEKKKNLEVWGWVEGEDYTILCDTEPHKVLKGMLKLLEEA